MSALSGSEYCGHQVAISRSCEDCTWSLSDSDAIRLGISPLCFRVDPKRPWHETVTRVIPHSNATSTSEFCDMSPKPRHPMQLMRDTMQPHADAARQLAHAKDDAEFHLVNVEYFYLEDEPARR